MSFKTWFEQDSTDTSYLLSPQGTIPQIGPEKLDQKNSTSNIKIFVSPHGSYRFVYYLGLTPVSALQVVANKSHGLASNVFTLPEYRRIGYARKLAQFAQSMFKSFEYSQHRSEDGKAWVDGL